MKLYQRSRLAAIASFFMLLPAALLAQQSNISGIVTDSSGAVIANANVTISSDVMIEKSKTATTNGEGRYVIIDLRPGQYEVVATMEGFSTLKQTVAVPANVTVTVDAQLKPGSVGETLSVEARVATVDIENATVQETLSRSEMDALPTARYMQAMAVYVPGARLNLPDVGGSQQTEQNYVSLHGNGSAQATYYLDGLLINTTYSDGQIQQYVDNAAIQETTYQTSNVSAVASGGGMYTNLVPKDGGNEFHGDLFAGGSGGSSFWQGSNVDDNLRRRLGAAGQNKTVKIYDLNGSLGGAIKKDKLWFVITGRDQTTYTQAGASTYPNGAPGIQDGAVYSGSARLVYQANAKNKFSASYMRSWKWKAHEIIDGGQTGIPFDPSVSATQRTRWPMYYILQAKWTSTLTSRLVTEAGLSISKLDYNNLYQAGIERSPFTDGWYQNTSQYDSTTSRRFVAGIQQRYWQTTRHYLSGQGTYVTGSHTVKFGGQYSFGPYSYSAIMNGDGWSQFQNGVPVSFLAYSTPLYQRPYLNADLGFFVTDTWRYKRLTFTYGLRAEYISAKVRESIAPAGRFAPARNVREVNCGNNPGMGCWLNFTPRIGIAWDVFGNHKTAIKAGFGRYNTQYATGFTDNFNPMTQQTQTIAWNPTAAQAANCAPVFRNGIQTPNPGCFTRGGFGQDGLGGTQNPAFGTANTPALDGNFRREFNLQYMASIQQQLANGVTLNVAWFRRSSYQGTLLLNYALPLSAYDKATITNPLDGTPITVFNQIATTVPTPRLYQTNAPRSLVANTYTGYETSVTFRLPRKIFGVVGYTRDRQLDRSCAMNSSLAAARNDPNSLRFCDWFGELYQELGKVSSPPWQNEFKIHGSIPIKWGVVASASLVSVRLQGGFTPTGSTSVVVNNGYMPRTWAITPTTRYPQDCKCATPGGLVNPGMRQASITVQLVAPGQALTDRLNQLDVGLRRVFKFKERYVLEPEVQFFNLLNSNAVIGQSFAVPASTSTNPALNSIANFLPGGIGGQVNTNTPPRLMRLALQFHF